MFSFKFGNLKKIIDQQVFNRKLSKKQRVKNLRVILDGKRNYHKQQTMLFSRTSQEIKVDKP